MVRNTFAQKDINHLFVENEQYSDLFVLCGEIDGKVMKSSIDIIENKLLFLNTPRATISKAKMLCVEIIQNISKHKKIDGTLVPYFIVTLGLSGFKLKSGNSISKNDYSFLKSNLSYYDTLSNEEVRNVYLKKLEEGMLSIDGNAGLGILTIVTKSHKKSEFVFSQISEDEYHFGIEVNLTYKY